MYWRRARWTRPTLPLVHSDVRRLSSSILTISTAVRLLVRVSALMASDVRWVVSAILAIATPQPLHTRTVITSASQRIVAPSAPHAARILNTTPSQPHNTTQQLRLTNIPPPRPRFTPRGISQAQARARCTVVLSLGHDVCVVAAPPVYTHASLCTSDAAVMSPDTLHSYCFTAATCTLHTQYRRETTPARQHTILGHNRRTLEFRGRVR